MAVYPLITEADPYGVGELIGYDLRLYECLLVRIQYGHQVGAHSSTVVLCVAPRARDLEELVTSGTKRHPAGTARARFRRLWRKLWLWETKIDGQFML